MTLKSDFSKFSHIVPFKILFGMTSKLTGIFFAASAQDSAQHIVGAQWTSADQLESHWIQVEWSKIKPC